MRVAVQSNGIHVPTAYGIQAKQLLTRLAADGHDVASFGWSGQGSIVNYQGIPQYPGGRLAYNADMTAGHVTHHRTQLLITLHDLMVIDPGLVRYLRDNGTEVWHWAPVDCEPLSVIDRAVLTGGGGRPVAMSHFGLRQLELAGIMGQNAYVPHSVDTSVFRLPDEDWRAQAREASGLAGKFVVAINAANKESIRKGWWEAYEGFAQFHVKHPDSHLLVHSESGDDPPRAGEGVPFDHAAALELLGLKDCGTFTEDYVIRAGLMDDKLMGAWYGLADVYLCASWAEGFGIPLVEAAACGLPLIGTDCSAITELVRGASGWLVPGETKWNPMHKARWRAPWAKAITQDLGRAYKAWQDRSRWQALQETGREFAVQYDADLVYDSYWRPLIRQAEEQSV